MIRIDALGRDVERLEEKLDVIGDSAGRSERRLIELVGESGKNGRFSSLERSVENHATKQGERLGKVEIDVAKLKEMRAVLYALAAIAMAILGTLVKMAFFSGSGGG